jgi:hypothetical protein
LPAQAIQLEAVAKSLDADMKELKVVVTIGPDGSIEKQAIEDKAQKDGIKLLEAPIDFNVSVEGNEKTQVIHDFGSTYVYRTVVMDGTANPDQATVLLYNPAGGSLTFVPATFRVENGKTIATIIRNGNSIYAIAEMNKSFADLSNHWAREDIDRLASKMIVNGVSEEDFSPDRSMTRAEFVALLVRGLGFSEDRSAASAFKDISKEDWFAGSVGAAVKAGLIDGFGDGSFKPDGTLTREQMAVLMVRAMAVANGKAEDDVHGNQALARFTDRNSIAGWAATAVGEAVAMKTS